MVCTSLHFEHFVKTVIFWLEFECEKAQSVELELSAIDVYKLYVNEKFCLFGPARAAFGYSRADKIECELAQGKNRIAVQRCQNQKGAAIQLSACIVGELRSVCRSLGDA